MGRCRFVFQAQDNLTSLLTTLAAFAHYAGVGYKTTMGMGQVQVSFDDQSSAILPDSISVSK
jgi:CRISPR/Cas system endoribonuclease Cas6 (RAMP superfamily)